MRGYLFRVTAAALWLFAAATLAPPARAAGLPPGESDIVATLLPQVVNISVLLLTPPPNGPKNPKLAAYTRKLVSGSGFIVDPSGIIVTNRHVIENAYQITVIFSDRTRRRATLVYTAPIDMALLKVEVPMKLPAVKFGDSALMRPGDPVIAIGNPLGIGTSVTSGIVSALDRDIQETPFDAFIQTDASINHGNSGGPLFNIKGEVIGINTALFSAGDGTGSVGIGFAIPGNDAKFVLKQVQEYGRVRQGWLGATGQIVTPAIADAVGMQTPHGVILDNIIPNSPAAGAKLQPGDIILKIGDQDIDEPRDYNRAVAATPFNTAANVEFWRDGGSHTIDITFTESPNSQPPAMAMAKVKPMVKELTPEDVGVQMAQITPKLRAEFKLPPTMRGVVITHVEHNSIAEEDGLLAGDVVVQVGRNKVATQHDLLTAVGTARAANERHLLVMVWRPSGVLWTAMPLVRDMDAPISLSSE